LREIDAQQAYNDRIIAERDFKSPTWAATHPQEDINLARIPEEMLYQDAIEFGYNTATVDEVLQKRREPTLEEKLTLITKVRGTLNPGIVEKSIKIAYCEVIQNALHQAGFSDARVQHSGEGAILAYQENPRVSKFSRKWSRDWNGLHPKDTLMANIHVNVYGSGHGSVQIDVKTHQFLVACERTLCALEENLRNIPGYNIAQNIRYDVNIELDKMISK